MSKLSVVVQAIVTFDDGRPAFSYDFHLKRLDDCFKIGRALQTYGSEHGLFLDVQGVSRLVHTSCHAEVKLGLTSRGKVCLIVKDASANGTILEVKGKPTQTLKTSVTKIDENGGALILPAKHRAGENHRARIALSLRQEVLLEDDIGQEPKRRKVDADAQARTIARKDLADIHQEILTRPVEGDPSFIEKLRRAKEKAKPFGLDTIEVEQRLMAEDEVLQACKANKARRRKLLEDALRTREVGKLRQAIAEVEAASTPDNSQRLQRARQYLLEEEEAKRKEAARISLAKAIEETKANARDRLGQAVAKRSILDLQVAIDAGLEAGLHSNDLQEAQRCFDEEKRIAGARADAETLDRQKVEEEETRRQEERCQIVAQAAEAEARRQAAETDERRGIEAEAASRANAAARAEAAANMQRQIEEEEAWRQEKQRRIPAQEAEEVAAARQQADEKPMAKHQAREEQHKVAARSGNDEVLASRDLNRIRTPVGLGESAGLRNIELCEVPRVQEEECRKEALRRCLQEAIQRQERESLSAAINEGRLVGLEQAELDAAEKNLNQMEADRRRQSWKQARDEAAQRARRKQEEADQHRCEQEAAQQAQREPPEVDECRQGKEAVHQAQHEPGDVDGQEPTELTGNNLAQRLQAEAMPDDIEQAKWQVLSALHLLKPLCLTLRSEGYRILCKKYHPDKNENTKVAVAAFQFLQRGRAGLSLNECI